MPFLSVTMTLSTHPPTDSAMSYPGYGGQPGAGGYGQQPYGYQQQQPPPGAYQQPPPGGYPGQQAQGGYPPQSAGDKSLCVLMSGEGACKNRDRFSFKLAELCAMIILQ